MKKMVQASDASAFKRFMKKHLGVTYVKDASSKDLKAQAAGRGGATGVDSMISAQKELKRRASLLEKSYQDAAVRDVKGRDAAQMKKLKAERSAAFLKAIKKAKAQGINVKGLFKND